MTESSHLLDRPRLQQMGFQEHFDGVVKVVAGDWGKRRSSSPSTGRIVLNAEPKKDRVGSRVFGRHGFSLLSVRILVLENLLDHETYRRSYPWTASLSGMHSCCLMCKQQNDIRPIFGVRHAGQFCSTLGTSLFRVSGAWSTVPFAQAEIDHFRPPEC
jgi:hypothetical protein